MAQSNQTKITSEYPFKIEEFYSVGLNSLKRIYTQHPKFNGDTRLIYELLLDYWNADYGYAFPTQWELSKYSVLSRTTVIKHIGILTELDLIEVKQSPVGARKNKIYYLKRPVTTLEAFYIKFPEIKEKAEERLTRIEEEEQKLQRKWAEDSKKGKVYTRKDVPKAEAKGTAPKKASKEMAGIEIRPKLVKVEQVEEESRGEDKSDVIQMADGSYIPAEEFF